METQTAQKAFGMVRYSNYQEGYVIRFQRGSEVREWDAVYGSAKEARDVLTNDLAWDADGCFDKSKAEFEK